MPTVLRSGPYRIFFYSSDGEEPPHVHVQRDDATAKFWLDPLRLERSGGFRPSELRRIRSIIIERRQNFWTCGMSTSAEQIDRPAATGVNVSEDTLIVDLSDGRTVSVPLSWYPRLEHASEVERKRWQLIGGGIGIHWDSVDEDISVEALLAGKPSNETQASLKHWLATRGA